MKEILMINLRTLALVAAGVLASAGSAGAQDLSAYRTFVLGSDLATVARSGALRAVDATVLHSRPALIQGLEWSPPYVLRSSGAPSDPVRLVEFGFYNGQLFRMTVSYDRDKVEGMTNEDLVAALSATYGAPILPAAPGAASPGDPIDWRGSVTLAEWDRGDTRVTLSRGTFPTVVRLVLISKQLSGLADSSIAEALRLDAAEAPQRDADRRSQERADTTAAQEKTRALNKAAFHP